jgi:transposase
MGKQIDGLAIAPVPAQLLPKSLATPALLAHITTAKFVDGIPLYRQEPQFLRVGVPLGRATMVGWMIKLGGLYVVPIINLLREWMMTHPLIHCDETRPQVLKSATRELPITGCGASERTTGAADHSV